MINCPICGNPAESGRESGGDFKQYSCPRCGEFKITGTALAMLPSRLASNAIVRARLSHSIRADYDHFGMTERPELTSVNLDSLLNKSLPSVEVQKRNLLKWAAAQVGDDRLGTIEIGDEEHLAGKIGAVDGSRVDSLISFAAKEGLIELVPDDCISITPQGWEQIEQSANSNIITALNSKVETSGSQQATATAHCNACNGNRNVRVRAKHTARGKEGDLEWSNTFEILECFGCGAVNVRHERWCSEWDKFMLDANGNTVLKAGIMTKYYPAPTKRTRPSWTLDIQDQVLRNLFDELYMALSADLQILATMGARTIFDRASFLQVGDVPGGFAARLKQLQASGQISQADMEQLGAMTDAGNASAHRGYSPDFDQISKIVDILENYVQRSFVLGDAAASIKKATPQRAATKSP